MNKGSKIYVAGHRGLVGSALVRNLQEKGYSNLLVRSRRELELSDQAAVYRFFNNEKPEYVFLAAARVGGIFANDAFPADFIRDNLVIQTNVIDSAYRSGVRKLLFLGSSCIYPKMAPQPIREEYLLTGPLEPTNQWYALAKIAGIKMCQAYHRQYGFNAVCVMPTNLYGPNDNFDLRSSHVLPAMIRKFHLAKLALDQDFEALAKDERRFGPIPDEFAVQLKAFSKFSPGPGRKDPMITLWGTGSPRREFLHVDDLAEACFFVMHGYDSELILNVGVGEDLTIKELAQIVGNVVGFNGTISFDAAKPDGTPRKLLDVERVNSLGWRSKICITEGIRETYKWYLTYLQQPAKSEC